LTEFACVFVVVAIVQSRIYCDFVTDLKVEHLLTNLSNGAAEFVAEGDGQTRTGLGVREAVFGREDWAGVVFV